MLNYVVPENIGLAMAAYLGQLESLKTMITDKDKITGNDTLKRALDDAFFLAAYGGQKKAIELIVEKYKHLDIEPDYVYALHSAAYRGQDNVIKLLAEELTPEFFVKHDALIVAAKGGNKKTINIIKKIISSPEVNQIAVEMMVVMGAAGGGYKKIMEDAFLNIYNIDSVSLINKKIYNAALINAAAYGYINTTRSAIKHGADDLEGAIGAVIVTTGEKG